jgi:hypothetical protein
MILVDAQKWFQPEWDEEIDSYIIPEEESDIFCFDNHLMIPKVDEERKKSKDWLYEIHSNFTRSITKQKLNITNEESAR